MINVTVNLAVLLQVIDVTLVFCTQHVYKFTNPLLVIVSDMLFEVKISKHKESYVRVHCNMCIPDICPFFYTSRF